MMKHPSAPTGLSQTTIAEVMTPSPHGIAPEENLGTALKRLLSFKIRHLPVRSGGKVVGMLSERDAELAAMLRNPNEILVNEVMTPDPYCVAPSTKLAEVLTTMYQRRIGSTMVVDHEDKLLGIFTDTDALRLLSEQFNP